MPQCPVCKTRSAPAKNDRCPKCDWELQPYSLVIGLIPEIAQKEDTRLAWAKQQWATLQLQQVQLQQVQTQLEAAAKTSLQLKAELEQSRQEHSQLAEISQTQAATLLQLQEQLSQSEQELKQLRLELEQLKQKQAPHQVNPTIGPSPVADSDLADLTLNPETRQIEVIPTELQVFSAQIVTVDEQGRQTMHCTSKVHYFSQDLGKDVTLEMVYIPAGSFLMGSPADEVGREKHEDPLHWVTLQPFYLSRFPITQIQWQAIAQLPQIDRPLNPAPANFKGNDLPVEQVSWYDAIEFCNRLSQITQRNYRLPSEAEWEYACRAGTTTPFHFGRTITSDLANYDGSYTYSFEDKRQYRRKTTAVGSFLVSNLFGLSDVHGNVWEWCADDWHDDYQNAPTNGEAWQLDPTHGYRVLRGGAWYCLPILCRSAQRHWDAASHAGSGISFRVACGVIKT